MLVVSPTAVYSIRRSEPTWPDMTLPLLMPTPIWKPSPRPCPPSHSLKRSSRGPIISSAAATARSAWSGCSIGAPKTAMIPSPM